MGVVEATKTLRMEAEKRGFECVRGCGKLSCPEKNMEI